TPSPNSLYLGGQGDQYPTVMLDLDGNERASIGLRNNTLNKLHVLLQELLSKKLAGEARTAALNAFFEIRGAAEPAWQRDLDSLKEQITAVQVRIPKQQALVNAERKKPRTLEHQDWRESDRLESMKADARGWGEYAATMQRLLSLQPSDFDPGKFKIE